MRTKQLPLLLMLVACESTSGAPETSARRESPPPPANVTRVPVPAPGPPAHDTSKGEASLATPNDSLRMDPYVSPAAVTGLPDAVRARLGERGCLVPLSRNADSLPVPQALSGAFYETGSTGDWAVTCSVPSGARRESTLLVFRSAAGYAADEIESMGWDERGDRRDGPLAARYLTTGISRQSFNATWTLGRQLGARDVARLGITPWESEQRMHDGVQADVGDPALHYWTGRRWVRIALTD